MKLSKDALHKQRAALLCPEGLHVAKLDSVRHTSKPTGEWISLTYATAQHQVQESFLIRPARKDLETLNVDHLERLLEAVQATLGIDEVDDLGAALSDMTGRAVQIVVQHREGGDGKNRAAIANWRAVE